MDTINMTLGVKASYDAFVVFSGGLYVSWSLRQEYACVCVCVPY